MLLKPGTRQVSALRTSRGRTPAVVKRKSKDRGGRKNCRISRGRLRVLGEGPSKNRITDAWVWGGRLPGGNENDGHGEALREKNGSGRWKEDAQGVWCCQWF